MKVRRYREADLDDLTELFTSSVHGLGAQQYDAAQREAWAPSQPDSERFRTRFAAMNVWLVEEEGALLGFVGFEDDGHIDFLYTAPGHARRGVATLLHDRAAAELARCEVTTLFTEASEVARPFFERQGYEVVEREVVERSGVQLPRYRMRRCSA